MAFELGHTSTPQGIDTGTSGYTTVVRTTGMPNDLKRTLEKLSAYVEDGSPPMPLCGFREVRTSGRSIHVASIIKPHGKDHSGRPNRIAWHLAFEGHEAGKYKPEAAIRWLLNRINTWDGCNATTPPPDSGINGSCLEDQMQKVFPDDWRAELGRLSMEDDKKAVVLAPEQDLVQAVIEILGAAPEKPSSLPTVCAGTPGTERDQKITIALVSRDTNAERRIFAGAGREILDLVNSEPEALKSIFTNEAIRSTGIEKEQKQHSRSRNENNHAYLFEEMSSKQMKEAPSNVQSEQKDCTKYEDTNGQGRSPKKNIFLLAAITAIALGVLILMIYFSSSDN